MKRIQQTYASASLEAASESGTTGYFTRGDAGADVPPTTMTAAWCNRVQEEICAVIEDVGELALDGDDNGQMAEVLHGVRGIRSGDAGGVSGPTPDQAAVVASSSGTADGLTSLVGASSGSRTNAGGWDTAVLASSGGVAVGNQSAVIASRDTSPSTPCEVHGDRSAIIASSVATIPTGAAQTAIVGSTDAAAAATASNALAAASSGAVVDGDQVAVIAGGGTTAAGASKAAVIAGDGTASGTASAVVASDSTSEASETRSAVIASEGSDAGDVTKANAAVVASINTSATGNRTGVLASQGGGASGTNAAVVASTSGQAIGTQAAVVAGESSQASGTNSAVLASHTGVASGDEAAAIGCLDSEASAERSVVVASAYTVNDDTYSIAGGYAAAGPADATNQSWRIESITGDFHGDVFNTGGADYAECFQNAAPGALPPGRLVALAGDTVRLAAEGDDPIGITSAKPAVLGDAGWACWAGRWQRDVFGALVLDADGRRIQSPDYDPTRRYVPRLERPHEWTPVGLMGKLPLAVDDTVEPGDYIAPADGGIGTKASTPTRVRAMVVLAPFHEATGYAVVRCLVR